MCVYMYNVPKLPNTIIELQNPYNKFLLTNLITNLKSSITNFLANLELIFISKNVVKDLNFFYVTKLKLAFNKINFI